MKNGDHMHGRLKFRRGDIRVRSECEPWDGREIVAEALWLLEADETSLYAGEWAMRVIEPAGFPRSWVASGDIQERGKAAVGTV